MKSTPLLSLVEKLKACPAHDHSVSREMFLEAWDDLRREDVTPLSKPTIPIMAALILSDESFADLLNQGERDQLVLLAKLALDRYEQHTNPPNKLGKLIAGSIRKEQI